MKKYMNYGILIAAIALFSLGLEADVGFNCPQAKTVSCQVFDRDPKAFVCSAEVVTVSDGSKALGSLTFYGPPLDITPGFDFTKGQWELVLGETSYGFPDCVYVDAASGTRMNFIYRPEDVTQITSLKDCTFQEAGKTPHIRCE